MNTRSRLIPHNILAVVLTFFLLASTVCAAEVPFMLQWDANHANDNVQKYRLYWSTTSGIFNQTDMEEVPVGSLPDPNNPQWTITLTDPDPVTYFVATAVDDEGFESDYSNQTVTDEEAPDDVTINSPPSRHPYWIIYRRLDNY